MAESCPVIKDRWIEIGNRFTEDFQRITRENPKYALLTGAVHSHVDFNVANRCVNKLAKLSNNTLKNRSKVFKFLKKNRCAVPHNVTADRISKGMRIFTEKCGEDGKLCLTKLHRDMLRKELVYNPDSGFQQKLADLTMEYLGDENAVCVDMHIKREACDLHLRDHPDEYPAVKCLESGKEQAPAGEEYEQVADFMRNKAKECGHKPIEYQVARWTERTCTNVDTGRMKRKEVILTPEHRYSCGLVAVGKSGKFLTEYGFR